MREEKLIVNGIPALIWGEDSDRAWLYVHGRCGCKEEGADFAQTVCPKGWQVLAIDLPEHGERREESGFDPWHAAPELRAAAEYLRSSHATLALRATSIGAWFSLLALAQVPLERALLVSPVLDMEKLIMGMMLSAGVDEERLRREGEISTPFGQTLSWEYLSYVRAHPIEDWSTLTSILYAGRDELTDRSTVDAFAQRFGCRLEVMDEGEHWFHTDAQLAVLHCWEQRET